MNILIELLLVLCILLRYVHSDELSSSQIADRKFPDIEIPHECKLSNNSTGSCIPLKNCPAAITAKTFSPCYEDGSNIFVCCKRDLWTEAPKKRLTEGCGNPALAIINGLRTEYMEFPYMVALGWESFFGDEAFDYKCGGVLIRYDYVLTAAHCAHLNGVSPSVVLVGGGDLTDSSKKPRKVIETVVHPDYKRTESYHDIALLKIEDQFLYTPICVWSIYSLDSLNCTAIGYGHTQFAGPSSDNLLKTYLTVVPNSECSSYFKDEESLPRGVLDSQLCAKDTVRKSDTCQGDSGGPLILNTISPHDFETPYVVGITSFGRGCAMDTPGVYTRVSEYIDWIEEIIYTKN
ncbi:serine protease snk-like [Haematobia irritans]|uniref:serine protease snk-like n=1 Tax=Haematobia irritans TaxID=7368 RepID=UPI003F4FF02A